MNPSFTWTLPAELTGTQKAFLDRAWPDGRLPEAALIAGAPAEGLCAVLVPDVTHWDWVLLTEDGKTARQGWELFEVQAKLRIASLLPPARTAHGYSPSGSDEAGGAAPPGI